MTAHTYTAVRLTSSDALVKLNLAIAAALGLPLHEPRNRHERRAAAKKRRGGR